MAKKNGPIYRPLLGIVPINNIPPDPSQEELFIYFRLPEIIKRNRSSIENTLRRLKSLKSVDSVMDSLISQRQSIYCLIGELASSSNEKKIAKLLELMNYYILHLLLYIKEQAFSDKLVLDFFTHIRVGNDYKSIQKLLEILLERKITTFKDSSIEDWCRGISRLIIVNKQIINLYLDQIKDSCRIVNNESLGFDFGEGGSIYPKDKEFNRIIIPTKSHRIFKDCGISLQEEMVLALKLYGLSPEKIGKLLKISRQAVEKKINRLWCKPGVRKAFEDKTKLYEKDLEDNEVGKTKRSKGKTSKLEDENEVARDCMEIGLKKAL